MQVQRKGKSEKIKQRQSKVGFAGTAGTTKHVSRFVVHGGTRQVSFKSSTASQVQLYVGTAAAYVPFQKLARTCAQTVIEKGLSKYHLGEWPY